MDKDPKLSFKMTNIRGEDYVQNQMDRNSLMEELRAGRFSHRTFDAAVEYIEDLESQLNNKESNENDVIQNSHQSNAITQELKPAEHKVLEQRLDDLTQECNEAYRIKNQIAAENTWIYAELKNIERSARLAVQAMESKSQVMLETKQEKSYLMQAPRGGSIEFIFFNEWASPMSLWIASKPETAKVFKFDIIKSLIIITGILLFTALALKAYPSISFNSLSLIAVIAAGAFWGGIMGIDFNRRH